MNDIETWTLGSPRLKATEAKYDGSLVLLHHLRDHQQYKLLQVELDLDTGEEAEGEGGEDEEEGEAGEDQRGQTGAVWVVWVGISMMITPTTMTLMMMIRVLTAAPKEILSTNAKCFPSQHSRLVFRQKCFPH